VILFQCPECQEKFEVEEQYAGRTWQCTNCQASVTIPETTEEDVIEAVVEPPRHRRLDDDVTDVYDRPAGERRRRLNSREEEREEGERRAVEDWPKWLVTRVGVRTLGYGVSILLVCWVFLIIAKYVAEAAGQQHLVGGGMGREGLQALAGILQGAVTVFLVAIPISVTLYINGQAICCYVPGPMGTKALAIGSLICSAVALVAALIGFLILVTSPGQRIGVDGLPPAFVRVMIFHWLVIGFAAVGHWLYLFFLEEVARHYGRVGLGINLFILAVAELLFLIFYIVVHIVYWSKTTSLQGENFGRTVPVGRAVEITFLIGSAGILGWLLVTVSLVGGIIRKPRSLRAHRD
jgi:hypothetical protein